MRSFSSVASAWKPGWLTRALARFERPDARFTDEEILTVIRAGEGLRVADVCAAADIPVETFYTWKARYGGLSLEALRDQRRSERRRARAKTVAVTFLLAGGAVGAAVLVSTLSRPAAIDSAAISPPPPRTTQAPAPSAAADATRPTSPGNVAMTPDSTTTASNTTGGSKPASTSALDAKPAGAGGMASAQGSASAEPDAKTSTPTSTGPKSAPPPAGAATKPPAATTAAAPKPAPPVTAAGATPKPAPPVPAPTAQTHVNAADIMTSAPEGISVQVAALPDLDEARMTVTKLKNAGYPAYMMLTVVNQNELYRVRVGPLKSRELAQIMAQRLERDGYAAPWITSTSR